MTGEEDSRVRQEGSALTRPPPASGHGVLVNIHADAGRFYQSCLPGSWVPGYLASRRLDAVLLPTSPWKIGYAPRSWTALIGHLRDLGYSDEVMLDSGLIATGNDGRLRDRFHDRLMVPLRRSSGPGRHRLHRPPSPRRRRRPRPEVPQLAEHRALRQRTCPGRAGRGPAAPGHRRAARPRRGTHGRVRRQHRSTGPLRRASALRNCS
jgi:hypothetical protein